MSAPAPLVEDIHAELLDVALATDLEVLFDFVFDGQAVAIPPEPAADVVATHGLVAGNDVLDGAGEEMAIVGQPRGEGRPVIKHIFRGAAPLFQRPLENMLGIPKLQDFLFLPWEIHFPRNRLKHSSSPFRNRLPDGFPEARRTIFQFMRPACDLA